MTAPTWPSVVAAVEHDAGCRSRQTLGASHPALAAYGLPCDCTRDARIGEGIAAVRESDTKYHDGGWGHDDCSVCEREEADARDAAAFAAFREATGTKEENDVPMR